MNATKHDTYILQQKAIRLMQGKLEKEHASVAETKGASKELSAEQETLKELKRGDELNRKSKICSFNTGHAIVQV